MFISELPGIALMSDESVLTPIITQGSVVSRSSNSRTVAFDREGS